MGPEARRRVTIAHTGGCAASRSVLLPDPRTGKPQCFLLLSNGDLLEVQHFKQMYSSWLVGNEHLLPDGGMHMCTPYDTLLLLLPLLDTARRQGDDCHGVFMSLDQLLEGAAACWPGLAKVMQQGGVRAAHLACLCDVKDVGGDAFYRLSDTRALAWLVCKASQARAALHAQLAGMSETEQHTYVCDFLAEYLPPTWSQRLQAHFKVQPHDAASVLASGMDGGSRGVTGEAQHKKAKMDPKELAREAARKKAAQARAEDAAKAASGMKKLSSFFAAKPKPAAA